MRIPAELTKMKAAVQLRKRTSKVPAFLSPLDLGSATNVAGYLHSVCRPHLGPDSDLLRIPAKGSDIALHPLERRKLIASFNCGKPGLSSKSTHAGHRADLHSYDFSLTGVGVRVVASRSS